MRATPKLGGDARDAHRGGQLATQLVDHGQGVADRVLVLEGEHLERDLGAHVGVAVAVAADPGAERERAGVERQLEAEPGELVGERLEHVRDGVAVELVEVVDGVARLVDDVGTGDAQLVGLPHQVDQLLQPAPGPAARARVQRSAGPGRAVPLVEQTGDVPELASTVRRAASVG